MQGPAPAGENRGKSHLWENTPIARRPHRQRRFIPFFLTTYVQQSPSHVQGLQVVRSGELIELPQTTRRNLELTQTLRGEDSPTLFSLLDTCTTGMRTALGLSSFSI